ncbi:MAG TPA: hypothetical protein VML55_01135 [Planctomycetaceae bacterium]|nr:hypothetical protein [Planctomycetaceae bacterium]
MSSNVTYGQLYRVLLELGFAEVPHGRRGKAFRSIASDAIILLADRQSAQSARPVDLIAVRRHLVDRGIISDSDFDRFLADGQLPRVQA